MMNKWKKINERRKRFSCWQKHLSQSPLHSSECKQQMFQISRFWLWLECIWNTWTMNYQVFGRQSLKMHLSVQFDIFHGNERQNWLWNMSSMWFKTRILLESFPINFRLSRIVDNWYWHKLVANAIKSQRIIQLY